MVGVGLVLQDPLSHLQGTVSIQGVWSTFHDITGECIQPPHLAVVPTDFAEEWILPSPGQLGLPPPPPAAGGVLLVLTDITVQILFSLVQCSTCVCLLLLLPRK